MTLVMLIIVVQALLPMKNEMMSTTCTTIVVQMCIRDSGRTERHASGNDDSDAGVAPSI